MNTETDTGRASKGTRLFSLGQVVCTPGAIEALGNVDDTPSALLTRHVTGDCGDLCEEDKQSNNDAIRNGLRVLSAYKLGDGTRLWVITEADRSVTTLLLPSEY
jgi:hypothetical protein